MADTTPLSIAFDFAKSGVEGARARLDNIRSRAGTLISAASIVTSFLGAAAIKRTKPEPGINVVARDLVQPAHWVAIGAFIGVVIACMVILWPRRRAWPFGMSGTVIVEGYADKDASLGATQRALVGFLECNRVTIETKLDTLYRVFTVGAALLGVEVLCWLIDLTWGKT
jgi:hypothetical protein